MNPGKKGLKILFLQRLPPFYRLFSMIEHNRNNRLGKALLPDNMLPD